MGLDYVNAQVTVVIGQWSILDLLWRKNHAHSGHSKLPVKMTSSDPGAVFHKQQLNPSEDNEAVIRVS